MEETIWLDILLDTEAVFRKAPHVAAGIIISLLVMWIIERPMVNRFVNPHRAEIEEILSRCDNATPAEAEIVKAGMQFGAAVRVGFLLATALIICWA